MLPVFTGKFEDEDLWYAFQKFDLDKSGYITAAELRQILAGIGQNFTDSEIKAMIATVDADTDGRLSFKGMYIWFVFVFELDSKNFEIF